MDDTERLQFNGHHWLHTMLYGVDKQQHFQVHEKRLKRKSIAEILVEGGEAERAAAKLLRTIDELSGLLQSQVTITPLDLDDSGPQSGMIQGIDLRTGTIDMLHGDDKEVVPFCEISEHSVYGFKVIPLITMQAEKAYKF